MSHPVPLFYTIADVQETTHLSRAMVNKLIRRGDLKVVKVGRCVRINANELQRWAESLETPGDAA